MGNEDDKSRAEVAAGQAGAPSTRGRLVEAARALFLAQGYEATSVKEILVKAGVNSGSLYYFFSKKEDLLLAVLDQYKTLLGPMVIDPAFAHTADPIERVLEVLQGYRRMLRTTLFSQGCPIGNLALEMSGRSEAVRKRIAENFEAWRVAIRTILEDAGDLLSPAVHADKLATFILTTMEGGVMLARAYRSIEPFDAAVDTLHTCLEQLVAVGDARPADSNEHGNKRSTSCGC